MTLFTSAAEIAAERDRIRETLDGWEPPAVFGLALVPGGADPAPEHFGIVNREPITLHCVVLSAITGYRSGDAAIPVTREQLVEGVALLEPAAGWTEHRHPNLLLWRDELLPALDADAGARLIAVFLSTEETDAAAGEDAATAAFRRAAASAPAH